MVPVNRRPADSGARAGSPAVVAAEKVLAGLEKGDEDAVKGVWDTQTKNGYSALMKLCDGPSVTVALLEKAIEQASQDSWGHQSGSGYTALHVLCGNVNADLSKELLDSATKSAGGGEAWAVAVLEDLPQLRRPTEALAPAAARHGTWS